MDVLVHGFAKTQARMKFLTGANVFQKIGKPLL